MSLATDDYNDIPYPGDLPIAAQREKIIRALRDHQVVIIAGDTGSGKTTQLPKMCLQAGRGVAGMIGCTQPRRVAATAMAARVAEELAPAGLAHLVGHKIRFHSRTTGQTRIKFMTDGILLAETQHDRHLRAYDTLIIDEAHERSLNIDYLLGYLKRLLVGRADLKIIITSATIDTEKFSNHFGRAPVIEVSGRCWPVEVRYQPAGNPADAADGDKAEEISHVDQAIRAIKELCSPARIGSAGNGDILVFMPTERDIREVTDNLSADFASRRGENILVLPLFGRLQAADQNRIFAPYRGRKIVVATNVAETSITVPGIRYVVDSGLARIASYNPRSRTTSLPVTRVSRASCDQRLGRCGRVGPGICIRLYSEADYQGRPEYTLPEIRRSNLAEVILRMIRLKLGNPATFPFLDPPSARAIRDGFALLTELGAIDGQRHLTRTGRVMANLPLDPCIARIIVAARDHNALREVTVIAAALTVQDPRTRPADHEEEADRAQARFTVEGSDFLSYLNLWESYQATLKKSGSRAASRKFCRDHFLSRQRMVEWLDIHDQIVTILAEEPSFQFNARPAAPEAVHQAVVSGFLRNIGLKKAKNIYQGAANKELMIFPGSTLFNKGGQWIVAAELVETTRLFARTAAEIKAEWLEAVAGPLCRSSYSEPRWEKRQGRVVADEKVTLFGLPIVPRRRVNYAGLSETHRREARRIFIQAGLVEGDLQGKYDFLEHNLNLVQRLEDMEDRLRQRGVMADDITLQRFYEERLDEEVCDRETLNRLLRAKRDPDFLKMREEDIMVEAPAAGDLRDFPERVACGPVTVDLSYRFAPGAEDDGVTATIPMELLPRLDPQCFEWLVPGLLREKIAALLRGLPKGTRKQLIPIPATAEEIARELTPFHGILQEQLARAIRRRFGLSVGRAEWPDPESLPPHLRMRFQVLDRENRPINSGRDFREVSGGLPAPASGDIGTVLDKSGIRAKWERDHIVPRDLADLPESIPIRDRSDTLIGFAYPGLMPMDDGEGAAIRLFASPDESRRATRWGVAALYLRQFPREFRDLGKECDKLLRQPAHGWLIYQGVGSRDTFCRDLLRFMVEEIFACRAGIIPTPEQFEAAIAAAGQKGVYRLGLALLNLVLEVLTDRRVTLDHINKFEQLDKQKGSPKVAVERGDLYRRQLARLLPADFLATFDRERLTAAARYFKGLRIRVERAHVSPDKDLAKAEKLAPFEARLEQEVRPAAEIAEEGQRLLEEYRIMLEEFRLSLFAPEIKTALPVSEKRLEKKWREYTESC